MQYVATLLGMGGGIVVGLQLEIKLQLHTYFGAAFCSGSLSWLNVKLKQFLSFVSHPLDKVCKSPSHTSLETETGRRKVKPK